MTTMEQFEQAPALVTPGTATRAGWSPARLAYWFYAMTATGAVIGQTWVALAHVPWSPALPIVVRVAAVLPFAVCLELLAMALSAMADERMRLGERAYGFRIFSAVVATVAVGILVAGHWPHLYWSASFGVMSSSAYVLWLLHSAARRRDALRAAGKLADTAPDYGLWRRLRHPVWTARAGELARQGRIDPGTGGWRPLGLYESLRAAHQTARDERRRPAVARAVEQVVRADQGDPLMAEVAVRTLDLDRLAAQLAGRVDYGAWADRLAPGITAPVPPGTVPPPRVTPVASLCPTAGGPGPLAEEGLCRTAPKSISRDSTAAGATVGARGPATPPGPAGRSPDSTVPPGSTGRAGVDEPHGVGDEVEIPSETAAAVAYWHRSDPSLHPAQIAEKIGRSERTVRRYWPPTRQRTVNGHGTSLLAKQTRVS